MVWKIRWCSLFCILHLSFNWNRLMSLKSVTFLGNQWNEWKEIQTGAVAATSAAAATTTVAAAAAAAANTCWAWENSTWEWVTKSMIQSFRDSSLSLLFYRIAIRLFGWFLADCLFISLFVCLVFWFIG